MLTLARLAVWKMFVFHNHLSPSALSRSSAGVSRMMIYLPIIFGTPTCCSTLRHVAPNVCFSLRLAFLLHAGYRWQVACLLAGVKGTLTRSNRAEHTWRRRRSLPSDTSPNSERGFHTPPQRLQRAALTCASSEGSRYRAASFRTLFVRLGVRTSACYL